MKINETVLRKTIAKIIYESAINKQQLRMSDVAKIYNAGLSGWNRSYAQMTDDAFEPMYAIATNLNVDLFYDAPPFPQMLEKIKRGWMWSEIPKDTKILWLTALNGKENI